MNNAIDAGKYVSWVGKQGYLDLKRIIICYAITGPWYLLVYA